jgi:hypothetical protein
VKNSIFQKWRKFIHPQHNELLNIIYNVSMSAGVKFPIFGDSFISKKYWKNEFFFGKKARVLLVMAGLRVLLTNTRDFYNIR